MAATPSVGNLNYPTTENKLQALFQESGQADEEGPRTVQDRQARRVGRGGGSGG